MTAVDIHIIKSPGFQAHFHAQAQRLAHPRINVHEAPYVAGSVIKARLRGFSLGTAPYVSWVDDDEDQVLDVEWIDAALDLLDSDPTIAAVYPQWQAVAKGSVVHASNASIPLEPHHLTIMRRDNVLPMLTAMRDAHPQMMIFHELAVCLGQLRFGRLVALPTLAYQWVMHDASARSVPPNPPALAYSMAHIQESLTYYRP